MRTIILANGKRERWADYLGIAKQEIVIDGEKLLERTIRLLRENGVNDTLISGPWPGYGVQWFIPEADIDTINGRLGVRRKWSRTGRTVILLGDVFYSEAAMRTIVEYDGRDSHLFARFGPSMTTGKIWAEIFANSFWPEHHQSHERSMRTVVEMHHRGELPRGGLWESYLLDHGHLYDGIHADGTVDNLGNATVIDDWTDDFDFPSDYDAFMQRWNAR